MASFIKCDQKKSQDNRMNEAGKKLLLKKIEATDTLPVPNIALRRLMKMLKDDNVDMSQIAAEVEKEQTLVAQILKLVNSVYFGLNKKVDTVPHAVNLVGVNQLRQMVYGMSVMEMFGNEQKEEWIHSYSTSVLMARLIEDCGISDIVSLELAMSMLMHDIGKLLFHHLQPQKYKMAKHLAQRDKLPIQIAERKVFGLDHAEAAGVLLEKWDLPASVYYPIINHHFHESVPEEHVLETALVQFVDWVDHKARGNELGNEGPSDRLLQVAGIEDVNKLHWVTEHRAILREIDNESKSLSEKVG